MSNASIIMGESGTGKSTSIRNLDPKETFIVNVLNKPLPFRGYKTNYTKLSSDGITGNLYSSTSYEQVHRILRLINDKRLEIKTLIIDDFTYLMTYDFMDRALEKGYDKFTMMAKNANDLLKQLPCLREDLDVFVLNHSEIDSNGKMKIKTIGKMLDEKIVIEGIFTMILQTQLSNEGYSFLTQGDINHIAKSPMGMFETKNIPNDLMFVKQKMAEYNNGDIPQ